MRDENGRVFLLAPSALIDVRVEMVVPSLATLLADSTRQTLCDDRPFLGAVCLYEFGNHTIFLKVRREW